MLPAHPLVAQSAVAHKRSDVLAESGYQLVQLHITALLDPPLRRQVLRQRLVRLREVPIGRRELEKIEDVQLRLPFDFFRGDGLALFENAIAFFE